jgi:diadenosine tetraphosphate (Ap4A) HIT family hydrolase
MNRASAAVPRLTVLCNRDIGQEFECLGNRNPHLHWHLVPRYRPDPRWGYPIWESRAPDAADPGFVTLTDPEYAALIDRIRNALWAKGG